MKRIRVTYVKNLSSEEWFCHFLRDERANILGILTLHYGERVRTEVLEDVVQEASVVVWRKLLETDEDKRGNGGVKTFMLKVCRHLLSHEMRGHYDVESIDRRMAEGRWAEVDIMLTQSDEQERIRRERIEMLETFWKQLKVSDRLLLTKYYWEQKSMTDIAREMGLKNESVAKNYKCRAVKALKELMLQNDASEVGNEPASLAFVA